jgi:hypothetical protein
LGLQNCHVNTKGESAKFHGGNHWIRVTQFGHYQYRESFDETEEWKTVMISKKSGETVSSPTAKLVPRPCDGSNHVSSKKIDDIQKQLAFTPAIFRSCYQSVIDKANNAHNMACDSSRSNDNGLGGKSAET